MATGPSPLTRGSRRSDEAQIAVDGSIPAHAGQPRTVDRSPRRVSVHPRSRGAAAMSQTRRTARPGPSPLTRGSPAIARSCRLITRSIPAHAGQPERDRLAARPTQVHPRSRGAAPLSAPALRAGWGPSPLTRGSRRADGAEVPLKRSIPAHAGQPSRAAAGSSCRWVHPRSRGAATSTREASSAVWGPSPLTRGSHTGQPGQQFSIRSIPAHAGQPMGVELTWAEYAVHPRSRGAAKALRMALQGAAGPSPLTRGSRIQCTQRTPHHRSIPAHAGQPIPDTIAAGGAEVHPRSRGAAVVVPHGAAAAGGPSPLTRGSR